MKTKNGNFFINCDEAKYICDKTQYRESSWWERLQLNIRFIYCSITRAYVKKNKKLTELINSNGLDCMDSQSKTKLKQEFHKELQKEVQQQQP